MAGMSMAVVSIKFISVQCLADKFFGIDAELIVSMWAAEVRGNSNDLNWRWSVEYNRLR